MSASISNAIYFRRRRRLYLPPAEGTEPLPAEYIVMLLKNLESLGFTFTERLIDACRMLSIDQLIAFYDELIPMLTRVRGAHREFRPMYPNFPRQVEMMSGWELYINAVIHYVTAGQYLPVGEREEHLPLLDNVELTVLDLGTIGEFEQLCRQIAASNTSLSEQDREDLAWFVEHAGPRIGELLPEVIPHRENMAVMVALLMTHGAADARLPERYCRTATDLLRVAVALSKGDVSLANPSRFRSFSRSERRLFLELLERQPNPVEDMLRWKGRWLRLGERLHPGEFQRHFPRAAESFAVIRNDLPHVTFNGAVERALASGDVRNVVELLRQRPGEFARRLDHLLRISERDQKMTLELFGVVAADISTPLLLQVREHFRRRVRRENSAGKSLRIFFPKGNLARAWAVEHNLPPVPRLVCERIVALCEQALVERFRGLPPLGRCYLDEKLVDFPIPFSQRSASRTLRALVRGSRVPLPENCRVLRFFVWWKNGDDCVDIDLSATIFDEDFACRDIVAFYNLKTYGGCHSGDIVDAPNGASEFIDITVDQVLGAGARYIVMTLNSFSGQPYSDLPECFAGWMARTAPDSGEIYEPKTVQDRADITANTQISIPLIIDVVRMKVIWCDMALARMPAWANIVHNNLRGITMALRAMADPGKPNLRDLFAFHIAARGERVDTPEHADTIFSIRHGTPFRIEEIAAEYLK